MKNSKKELVGTHWGAYWVETEDGAVVGVEPSQNDSNPSPIGNLLYDAKDSDYRISQPMVRSGYLKGDSNNRQSRGMDSFVPVSWDKALDLGSSSIKKVKEKYGNSAIFGGSYGWSSAGRFHHAQSQVHRFLNRIGGYTASVNTYSHAAAEVIIPHVLGVDLATAGDYLVKYDEIVKHCDLCISFGGIGNFNNQVLSGGLGDHRDKTTFENLSIAGTEVISISPFRPDSPPNLKAEWITAKPCTDVAIMLAIAHHLETSDSADQDFINRYTVGYDEFKKYLLGHSDNVVKDADWAASISGIPASDIERLADKLTSAVCPLITISPSLQRAEHGEQPFWMAVVLAAMLGSIGKPGGGVGLKWGSNGVGLYHKVPFKWGRFPQGKNPISESIPVARIADMLLNPGGTYTYNGENRTYPDIQLVYWAGGNPFHHHQDLNKLRRAWREPETVIVNESVWSATARHADIVFPANTFLERNDIVCRSDSYISPSKQVSENFGESRSDYEIFCGLSERLGVLNEFSEGRDEMEWVEAIYHESFDNAEKAGIKLPTFEDFWEKGDPVNLESQMKISKRDNFIARFIDDPNRNQLRTPSGKIEIFSSNIDSFGYTDCLGHPVWFEKSEWLGAQRAAHYPLHMISPQPHNRLHSQFDFGDFSRKDKTNGRETVTLNPEDAHIRGITSGMLVRIFNDRGACLAGAHLSDHIMQGVIRLPTGAWYCPNEFDGPDSLEYHGNPNVLTVDKGTSSLSQGPSAHSCLVDIEPYKGHAPEIHELLTKR
ncbi:molybdopterin-dependent oxidoreductase [Oceanobacillus neutriphilus]|uniref:Dimethylsulfoxide reductase n=1 Tax=Oceanobacillus neutriphilus TaxID=531815 RepID=A0ABQ2P1Z2_9BACI|nr:molybdopterin-dependent oxidoreductase [Oceanobacillus neutriphilus]GGP15857.1 dimethylsulfoxide reductase [Oceanobacillus neutriphilus]